MGTTRPHSVVLSNVDVGGRGFEIMLTVGLDDGSALRAGVDSVTGEYRVWLTFKFLQCGGYVT